MNSRSAADGDGPRLSALPRYLSAVLSQGLVSGFHFVLNLMLVRLLGITDFGIFALTFVIAIIATSVSNALVATPLSVYAPAAKNTDERRRIESMLTTLMAVLLGVGMGLGVLVCLGVNSHGVDIQVLIAALGFIIAYLARQYGRSFGYSRFDVIAVLIGDMTYVVCGIVLFSLLAWSGVPMTVTEVFTVLTIANAIAVLVEVARLPAPIDLVSLRRMLRAYRPIWNQTRWALIGAITTVVVSQAHSLVVSASKGPAAYAPLAAGFVIFGPVRVVFTTIQNVIKPEMALAIAQNRGADARQQMFAVSCISLAAVTVIIALVLLVWPILAPWLYSDKYADAPMQQIVLLWAGVTLIGALQNGPYAALQSLRAFRPLAIATVYGSILSLTLVTGLMMVAPIQWSIGGIFLAEAFIAIWVIRLSLNSFKTYATDSKLVSR